jgi:16S rRNA (guanine966-N2)-methyltransferase
VKEGLFNILAQRLNGAKVLDLFAGTGSLSIEALSRGARLSVLVERNHAALKAIRENLEITGFAEKAIILNMDVFNALNKLSQSDEKFDIILIDPPYGTGLARRTAAEVLRSGVLGCNGVIVAEYDRYDDLEKEEAGEAEKAGKARKTAEAEEAKKAGRAWKTAETGEANGAPYPRPYPGEYPRPYREKKYGRTVLAFYGTDAMFAGNGEDL